MEAIKNILKGVAPFIGNMIGGPLGGMAMKQLAGALLGDENASEEQVEEAIKNASPESFVKLKEIDAKLKAELANIGLDEKRIAAMDRDSARQREVETGDDTPAILAYFLTFGFFATLVFVCFVHPEPEFRTILELMIGSLGTVWVGCMTYYFGSSTGSKLKDAILDKKING